MFLSNDFIISQGLFLKGMGLIYLIAFGSLLIQVKGLYGSQGIESISDYINELKSRKTWVPSLFMYCSSDNCLMLSCWIGILASIGVLFGVYPAMLLSLLWILYFSFYTVGYPFLNYQWDALLLEVGFLSIFLGIQSPPPILLIYMLWFLLFRLMFSSGITKLIFGSREWRDLTAMDYHYETQPLPTFLGYYAHQQPKSISQLVVLGVYFFEIVVPFFIFGPEVVRLIAGLLLVLFQVFIILTGNYAFFNLLTIVMCIPLFPDSMLSSFVSLTSFSPLIGGNLIVYVVLSLFGGIFIFFNTLDLVTYFRRLPFILKLLRPLRQYSLVNSYGLFVHMTTVRDEIFIEGSDDGEHWEVYEFKWKPGDLSRAPSFVAPHQPRLDWQMWFAALGTFERNPWFGKLLLRILQGSDDVQHLFKKNPFPEKPPTYVRTRKYRYHFTDLKTKRQTGEWWTRTYLGKYSSEYSLSSASQK